MATIHTIISDTLEKGRAVEQPAYTQWVGGRTWSAEQSRLPFLEKETENTPTRRQSTTAWMNGLRGLACLVVFNFHYFFAFDEIAMLGYGANERLWRWIGLPGIRVFYEGVTSVSIFFCISGYVCSIKALKLMAAKETDQALRGLVTSVFRRYLRLYLPVLFCMCCQVILAQMGAYDPMRRMLRNRAEHFPGIFGEPHLTHAPSMYRQIRFMLTEFWTLSEMWRPGMFYPYHDPHYWTIQKEFGSGLFLFLALVGLAGCKNSVRFAGLLLFAGLANWYDKFDTMLFLLGAAMAQYDVLCSQQIVERDLQTSARAAGHTARSQSARGAMVRTLRFLGYTAAIYFMSFPRRATRSPAPNDRWVLALIPPWIMWKEMYVKSVGSILLISLLLTSNHQINSPNPSWWHRVCNSRFALYMGRIMYPFYLIHGTVLHTYGYRVPYQVWEITGQESRLTWLVGFGTGWIVSFLLCIWLSELFVRYVEPRCARITACIEECCS